MQRWQGAALAVVLCAGCLDPLVEDAPGYSRHILPAGMRPPSAYGDLQINRKIDMNDGVTAPEIPLKAGFADGVAVQYWDFGASKRAAGAAYGLANCNPGQPPEPRPHPIIIDSIPGDTDYTPFRLIQWACVTPKYANEVIPSFDALSDAVDMGLLVDPTSTPAPYYVNCPVVTPAAELVFPTKRAAPGIVYYKGTEANCHWLEGQEGRFTYMLPASGSGSIAVPTPNVYEIVKPGSMAVSRVVFSKGFWNPENGAERNPAYSPNWLVVTVELKAQDKPPAADALPEDVAKLCQTAPDAFLETAMRESDLVKVGMSNALTPNNPCVAKATATMNRVNRPFLVREDQ